MSENSPAVAASNGSNDSSAVVASNNSNEAREPLTLATANQASNISPATPLTERTNLPGVHDASLPGPPEAPIPGTTPAESLQIQDSSSATTANTDRPPLYRGPSPPRTMIVVLGS
ncbi:hypothetical protein MD484_g9016, partial [Candolleomyces efflorescens]